MTTANYATPSDKPLQPKWMTVIGWVFTALLGFVLCFGGVMGLVQPASMKQQMKEGNEKMGWPDDVGPTLGVVVIVSGILYLFPKTTVLGAILLTGYLGGAVAVHTRVHDPMWVVPVVFGVLVWLGVFLREPRFRSIAFWRG